MKHGVVARHLGAIAKRRHLSQGDGNAIDDVDHQGLQGAPIPEHVAPLEHNRLIVDGPGSCRLELIAPLQRPQHIQGRGGARRQRFHGEGNLQHPSAAPLDLHLAGTR